MLLVLLITVILMLTVPTLLVASPVPVTKDTMEMEIHVIVSGTSHDILMTLNQFFKDINECTGTPICDTNADCADTPGSFTCTCNQGYTGDGFTCTSKWNKLLCLYINFLDANECATGTSMLMQLSPFFRY